MLAMNQNKNDIPSSLLVREYFEVTKIADFFTFFIYKKIFNFNLQKCDA